MGSYIYSSQPTESCADCSKKVPKQDMPLHRELLCPSKHTVSLPKTEVKSQSWEQRLVDESCGNDVQALLQKGKEWEKKYLQSLPRPGIFNEQNSIGIFDAVYLFQVKRRTVARALLHWNVSRQLLDATVQL